MFLLWRAQISKWSSTPKLRNVYAIKYLTKSNNVNRIPSKLDVCFNQLLYTQSYPFLFIPNCIVYAYRFFPWNEKKKKKIELAAHLLLCGVYCFFLTSNLASIFSKIWFVLWYYTGINEVQQRWHSNNGWSLINVSCKRNRSHRPY